MTDNEIVNRSQLIADDLRRWLGRALMGSLEESRKSLSRDMERSVKGAMEVVRDIKF